MEEEEEAPTTAPVAWETTDGVARREQSESKTGSGRSTPSTGPD